MPKSPGVYIDEINDFPKSVVPVETAVPAFIGYTPQAVYKGKSYTNVPQKIASFAEFQAIYCLPDSPAPESPKQQYSPQYYLVEAKSEPEKGDYMLIDGTYYSIVPDPNTIYYLYNSIKLFFENGGGDAYIVSVGPYGKPSSKPMTPGDQIINPNVHLNDLMKGLALLKNEKEPTMYICPEATLLSVQDNGTLMQKMLLQNSEMQTAISILDIIGGRNPDPILYTYDIQTFRNKTGSNGLNYGAAYYPFLGTTIMQSSDINFTNLFAGDLKKLTPILSPAYQPNVPVEAIIANYETGKLTSAQANSALVNASKTYVQILKHVLTDANVLPPSGAMAGVITTTDNQKGVWYSPANKSIVGATSLSIRLSSSQKDDLNFDAMTGKSINVFRSFNGLGIAIGEARTLDGNSQDWTYLQVRRTMTFVEQSCKLACQPYVFQPNDINTWKALKTMLGSFLKGIWKQGGLQGAKPSDAYSVDCGLGTTMTSNDILNGIMKVSIRVAIVHPGEFMVLEFELQMATS